MPLKYDRDTAVYRNDSVFYDELESKEIEAYNISGTSQQPITDKVSYYRTSSGTETANEDFIATECQLSVECGDNSTTGNAEIFIDINGVRCGRLSCSSEAGESASQSVSIRLPNWKINEGEDIVFTVSTNDGSASGVIIGYKL